MSGEPVATFAVEDVELDRHERTALEVLRAAASDVLADGRARLEVQRWPGGEREAPERVLALIPADPAACLVRCSAHVHGTDLWLGPDATLVELWDPDPERRREDLDRHVRAVLAGRYAERTVQASAGRLRRRAVTCREAIVDLGDETVVVRHWDQEHAPDRAFGAY